MVAALVLAAGLAGPGTGSAPTRPASSSVNPVVAPGGGVRNSALLYGGVPENDAAVVGKPAVVVTTARAADNGVVARIHATGAKAYRYVQFYWAPEDEQYEGIDLASHPDWAYCAEGATPALGRTTDGGTRRWIFIDTNETAVRAQIRATLTAFKTEGWDGVMFDRGEAATQYAADVHGHPIWYRRSTCTAQPYQANARFADAYVNMIALAHATGLQAMLNNGKSPFDSVTPMRPDPTSTACQRARWSHCPSLSDVWPKLDLVLNESAARPKDSAWKRTFAGNRRSERSTRYGRRTVGLITTASLGGAANQTRPRVFYEWSRIKLFNLSVAVNTGEGGCSTSTTVCNQHGLYPDLVDTTFGRPRGTAPTSQHCARRSRTHCVWTRRYADGVNVVNVQHASRHGVRLTLGTRSCRHVYDVYAGAPLAGNRCVRAVKLNLPPWSGRPLRYSRIPW